MPANTPNLAFPYPLPADTVDVPRDVKALADKLDITVTAYSQGLLAARPAPGAPGREFYATDEGQTYLDIGTGWVRQTLKPSGFAVDSSAVVVGRPVRMFSTIVAGASNVSAKLVVNIAPAFVTNVLCITATQLLISGGTIVELPVANDPGDLSLSKVTFWTLSPTGAALASQVVSCLVSVWGQD